MKISGKSIIITKKVKIISFAVVILLLLFLLVLPYLTEKALTAKTEGHSLQKEYDWYILPKNDNTQPSFNEHAGFIKEYKAIYIGNPNEKNIYLTFDAGYENGNMPTILDALKKHKAPAAFFLTGNYIKRNPELIKRMAQEGHLVCNHSMNHKDVAKITSYDAYSTEVLRLEEFCRETTGVEMAKYFRPPEGSFSELSLKYTQELGYTTVFWSFAYVDWYNDKQPTEEEGIKKILGRTHPGAILLLHATSATNGAILDRVITKWEEMGFILKSLDEFKK